jgi:hypothetical protein
MVDGLWRKGKARPTRNRARAGEQSSYVLIQVSAEKKRATCRGQQVADGGFFDGVEAGI